MLGWLSYTFLSRPRQYHTLSHRIFTFQSHFKENPLSSCLPDIRKSLLNITSSRYLSLSLSLSRLLFPRWFVWWWIVLRSVGEEMCYNNNLMISENTVIHTHSSIDYLLSWVTMIPLCLSSCWCSRIFESDLRRKCSVLILLLEAA